MEIKALGIVRRIDHLGRIVLPKEQVAALEIKTNDVGCIHVCENEITVFFKEDCNDLCNYKRSMDKLGRIVIPKEYRKLLEIEEYDELEIFAFTNKHFRIRKYKKVGE